MDLYLLRHAKSAHDPFKWKTDGERPLSKKGLSRQRHCSNGMKKLGIQIDKALVSPYIRARQTFKIVQKTLNLKCPVEYDEDLIVFENPKKILKKIEKEFHDNPDISLLLVGHNPHLSDLLTLLVGNQAEILRTSELAKVKFRGEEDSFLEQFYTRDALMKLT
ncbi:MAG: phosphohistidine phosphatase SixA [Candidatus Hodarchaeales archaeon]